MTGYTQAAKHAERRTEWAPYRTVAADDHTDSRSKLSGLGVLAALVIFTGATVAAAKGPSDLAVSFAVSPESLVGVAWLIQGAAALLCFVLAVRWLRS